MDMDIVIVDDDAVVLFLHKILIQKSQLPPSVFEFEHAAPALDFLAGTNNNGKPVLIFLDINMPEISGWDFLEKMNSVTCPENLFVVMVTSSINKSDRERAKTYSRVISYIEKPLSVEACNLVYHKIRKKLDCC